MTAIRDLIVAGSVRTEVTTWERTVMSVICGRCGSRFDADADGRTATCKACGRTCRLEAAVQPGPDVIPIRRGRPRRWSQITTTTQDTA